MYILETFTDTWNYTFVIVAVIAIIFGTIVTLRVNSNERIEKRRQKRERLAKYEEEQKQKAKERYEKRNNN